jgi:iron-sulfur cluster repair protein YtfE (RIC family)
LELRAIGYWKQGKKANKLELNWNDLFSKQADLVNTKTTQLSELIDMSTLKNQLQEQFKALYEITKLTDKSFVGL